MLKMRDVPANLELIYILSTVTQVGEKTKFKLKTIGEF